MPIVKLENDRRVDSKALERELFAAGVPVNDIVVIKGPHTKTIIKEDGTEEIEFHGYEFEVSEEAEAKVVAVIGTHSPEKTDDEQREEKKKLSIEEEIEDIKKRILALEVIASDNRR